MMAIQQEGPLYYMLYYIRKQFIIDICFQW